MIKKLQVKIIVITMGVLLLVFATIFVSLNIYMNVSSTKQTQQFLEMVAQLDGRISLQPKPPQGNAPGNEKPFSGNHNPTFNDDMMRVGRFFFVKVDQDGGILEIEHGMMGDFSQQEAEAYAALALQKSGGSGTIDNMQYLIAEKEYGAIVVFCETSIENQLLRRLMKGSAWIAAGSGVVLFIFTLFLSKWMVKPVGAAFEKQKRFIADASHELKTPLTIISANLDLLESESGANERTASIRSQSERMQQLIHDLLALARTDEQRAIVVMAECNLSEITLRGTLEFESRAYEEAKTLEYDIDDNIVVRGSEQQLRQVISILVDNAIKHSDQNGQISVSLKRENSKIWLSVFNTGACIDDSETEKIFDRFYRSDTSRSRATGGYGLGLSIAKANVEAHKGKIFVTPSQNGIRFNVVL